ncbi:L-fucose:H+ symporter permease [Shewanella sp. D64]|uniref:L-fucose:H+ symporter permease n=1 Tax=unclassified Shewanella TaxID=196818 RepID=UPI0022BA4C4F|nr:MULTISPECIES: L-fucose:H+ symporter permease [unclassified Shewanella]MEC4723972.1 L-fucose:H+ symporter permease [Shewanella sp. D64]MEC4735992.1 L-fucose:H+ symporter permease [Shewanella sp. E94]WBJ93046.1 L-fucose:H+ symporter permease [Shewanella sp. MTB7]
MDIKMNSYISEKQPILSGNVVTRQYLVPFVLITFCFALWGFANDITNPMVAAFQKIFMTGATEATWIQVTFYGGYGAMAIPAALFIRKYSYKAGILVGLALYAIGGLLFIPASVIGDFFPFLVAYFVITCGLFFLETTANPYILSMGNQETATRRLNLAQAFNPIGSLIGMFTASQFILINLDGRGKTERALMTVEEFDTVKHADLSIVSQPYIFIGLVILLLFVFILMFKMPTSPKTVDSDISLKTIFSRLFNNKRYREGVIAQMFYVGAQIMCWTFIIHYGTEVFVAQGMAEKEAQIVAQEFNIIAMAIFCLSRFVCTFLLKYISAGKLLMSLSFAAIVFTLGTIFIDGIYGLYCLVAISACMSLMFPTIYGIALTNIHGDDAKFAAAGLIMAIVGGTFLPMMQAIIIDHWVSDLLTAIQASFFLPLVCFILVSIFGYRTMRIHHA